MTPESITTCLEWSKKLKEAGWQQDNPLFKWEEECRLPDEDHAEYEYVLRGCNSPIPRFRDGYREIAYQNPIAAPTFEEILNAFRDEDGDVPNIQIGKTWYRLHLSWDFFSLLNIEDDDDCFRQWPRDIRHDSMADLAADVWCYLKENNLLPA